MTRKLLVTTMLIVATGAGAAFAQGGKARGMSFETLDINGDGAITEAELLQSQEVRFNEADTNNDGQISKDEMLARVTGRAAERVDRMIERMDENGDGQLSQAEMQALRDPGKMFDRIDANDDGSISEEEFAEARQKVRGRWKERRKNGG